jgi:hypothetical protein
MRISANPKDPDWCPEATNAEVYLDGTKLNMYTTADEEKGEVIVLKIREGCIEKDKNGDTVYETLKGHVRIVLKG